MAEILLSDATFKTQDFMRDGPKLQMTHRACLLIAVAGFSCPLAAKADDATTAAVPAGTNAPAAATAPGAANIVSAADASAVTNAPTAATALASTNQPADAVAPVTADAPAALKTPAAAQPETTAPVVRANGPTVMDESKGPVYQSFNLGAGGGTTGFGGTVGWRFADHFGLAGGMDYLKFSLNKTYSGVPYSGNVRMQSEYAGINYYPSSGSSFHVSLGAYFNQNQFTGSAVSTTDGGIIVNGYPVPAGTSVNLDYQQQPVNPFASIGGNLYFDKAHHFSLGAELGAFYLGNPRVSVSTNPSGIVPQSDLNAYQQQVVNDIKKFPVWPVLKLSLNYSF